MIRSALSVQQILVFIFPIHFVSFVSFSDDVAHLMVKKKITA